MVLQTWITFKKGTRGLLPPRGCSQNMFIDVDEILHMFMFVRVRVRERLSATPGHVIGQGPAPGGGVVPCGGGGRGELKKLGVFGRVLKSC